jgi:hypothetical protein
VAEDVWGPELSDAAVVNIAGVEEREERVSAYRARRAERVWLIRRSMRVNRLGSV